MPGEEDRWAPAERKPLPARESLETCGACLLALLAIPPCQAEEIAPFKLTGIDGHVVVDYLRDKLSTRQTGAAIDAESSLQAQANLRQDVFVMSHSYVYHPNLLTLDIGGGPILQQTDIDLNGNRMNSGDSLYNFTARANILRDKPLHGSLFYDHLNPTVTVAPGEIMAQESRRYGFDFARTGVGNGYPLTLGILNTATRGSGSGRVVDDELAQFNLNVTHAFGTLGSSKMQYQSTDQTSRSGSLNLPIQATTAASKGLNLNTQLQFGATRQHDLTNNITFNKRQYALAQSALPDNSDFGFLLDLRTRPSNRLSLFGTYHLSRSDQGSSTLVNQVLAGGVSMLPTPALESNLDLRLERSNADRYAFTSRAAEGSIRYMRPLRQGNLQISYGMRFEQRDQHASNPLINIIDEQITLTGSNQNKLNRLHVVTGSIGVTNLTRTQTYIENLDYLVIVVGNETRLQRLSSGTILDGEDVLVNYTYDIGGIYASSQLDQTLSLNWNLSRQFETYLRIYDSAPRITSGVSTFPLNSVRDLLFGMKGEFPFVIGVPVTAGGSYEWEDRRETISPYQRYTGEIFTQTTEPLFGLANLRMSGRRNRISYAFSDQDVDLTGFELRLWARRFGLDLITTANYEHDVGGTTPRSRKEGSVNAVWRERKVTVTASLVFSHEAQGAFRRDRNMFQLVGRRVF